MRFASPLAFVLLSAIPAVIAVWIARRARRPAIVLPSVGSFGSLPQSPRAALQPVLLVLRCAVLALLVAALARPQLVAAPPPASTDAVDVFVVLDVSSSMASMDFPPLSRFDVARRVISAFVDGRPGDRLGLQPHARPGWVS